MATEKRQIRRFQRPYSSCADEVVGPRKNIRQPWLFDATYEVSQDKAAAKLRNDTTQRKRLQGVFKAKAKADRNAYYSRIATDVEEDIQCNRMGSVFKAIRTLAGKVTTPSSVDEPTLDEVRSAVVDGIPAELPKCAIGPVSVALHQLFIKVRRSGTVPAGWRNGIIITKRKGLKMNVAIIAQFPFCQFLERYSLTSF